MNDKKQGKSSKALARALTTAFAHNSADPRVAATSSAPAITSGSTRRSRRHGRPRTLSDSVSVEVVVLPPPTKRFRTRARAHVDDSPLSSSAHAPPRQRTKRRLHASTSPRRKRRRVNRRGDALDERELDADDDVVEIVADAPRESRRAQSAMPRNKHQPPQFKLRHASQRSVPSPVHTSISIPTRSHSPSSYPQPQSPVTPPDVNTLAGLPLTILPAPAPADIVIPHRALNHLHASPGPPDLGAEAKMSESESGNGSQGEMNHKR
ncbi:hypothetical protein B0F90DRAFT_281295 [Multifurca ochricompacta]|uniref:Uncharacterized protein n=1 Tax=Multifurca ochricompacta TaxID=376703 RepID=A0AAD4LVZ2_9AGAM|nr:hypothetical protein B0F90DRAFT_281295 [Multifurca ochricompacta]